MSEVTRILDRAKGGDMAAAAELLPLVYEELRRLAAQKLAREAADQTLQPTALVHEAWLRLAGNQATFANRAHFFAAAAEAMRRILIDNARRKRAQRHGGGQVRVDIQDLELAVARDDELLAVHEALDKLATEDRQLAELVKLRFFVGLTNKECAETLGVSEPTVERWWAFARAWLFREINAN